jgi:hypothetical protein
MDWEKQSGSPELGILRIVCFSCTCVSVVWFVQKPGRNCVVIGIIVHFCSCTVHNW